jgi:hypothetical protein
MFSGSMKKLKHFRESNENGNTSYQNMWSAVDKVPEGNV